MQEILLRFATEVRHSLHCMLGCIELAVEEPLSEAQLSHLARCRAGGDRLLQISSDLWELSQSDPTPAAWSSFPLAAAILEVVDLERVFAERKGHVLDCIVPSEVELSFGSTREIVQDTIRRILDNAIRHTAAGRILLTAEVRGVGEATALIVEVADSGTGMPETVLASVRSNDDTLLDNGLSLAVVRFRVAKVNGEFSVVSSPAAGTVVRWTMPVRVVNSDNCPGKARSMSDGPIPLKILVAEDSDDGYFVFQGYTSRAGHKLTRAFNGAEAVELAKTGNFNLIVMDATMPIMDGYVATHLIREWETATSRRERMPILLFSADDSRKQTSLGSAAGCSGYLAKPASKAEVLKALKFFSPQQAGVL